VIRVATLDDLDTIRTLREELHAECPPPEHRRKEWSDVVDDVRAYIGEGGALIADEDGDQVGFTLSWPEGERVGYLGLLYVRPAYRRRGIGRALVRASAARLDRDFLTLSVDVHDQSALAFYGRLGFREEAIDLVLESSRLAAAGEHAPSFGSVHVQTDDVTAVANAVRQFRPRMPGRSKGSVVSPPRNGWVAVYDELCDREPTLLARLARELSDRMGAVTLALALEHRQVVHYLLYERGRMVDEYVSMPEYHGPLPPGDVVALGANPTVVARLTGADPKEIRAIARTASPAAELPPPGELLAALARAMRIEGAEHGYAHAAGLQGATAV
jgi:ribosomal protein S18 acetylase RimI-like enzyme